MTDTTSPSKTQDLTEGVARAICFATCLKVRAGRIPCTRERCSAADGGRGGSLSGVKWEWRLDEARAALDYIAARR